GAGVAARGGAVHGHLGTSALACERLAACFFFFKQKTAYEIPPLVAVLPGRLERKDERPRDEDQDPHERQGLLVRDVPGHTQVAEKSHAHGPLQRQPSRIFWG